MGVLIMSLNQMPELNGLVFLSGAPHSCKQDSHTFVYLDYSVRIWILRLVFFFFAVGYLLLEHSCPTTGCVYTAIYKTYRMSTLKSFPLASC